MSSRRDRKRASQVARAQRAAQQRRHRTVVTAILVAVIVVVGGGIGAAIYATQRHASDTSGYAVPSGATRDQPGLVVSGGPTTVDIYFDFLCSACKQFQTLAETPLESYTSENSIRLVYHPLHYLDSKSKGTKFSTRAAAAAGCAADADQLPSFITALYAKQPRENTRGLSNAQLVAIGKTAGITGSTFRHCVTSQKYATWVTRVTQQATEKGITTGPAVYVDNQRTDATATALTTAIADAR